MFHIHRSQVTWLRSSEIHSVTGHCMSEMDTFFTSQQMVKYTHLMLCCLNVQGPFPSHKHDAVTIVFLMWGQVTRQSFASMVCHSHISSQEWPSVLFPLSLTFSLFLVVLDQLMLYPLKYIIIIKINFITISTWALLLGCFTGTIPLSTPLHRCFS